MPVEAIWQQIDQRYDGFPPQLRRAARYVRDHPQDVALNSLRAIAGKAGVSPTSMTRLMQALKFENFDEFQEQHRRWLTHGKAAIFSRRAGELIDVVRTPAAEDLLVADFLSAEKANLDAALAPHRLKALKRAAEIVAAAPGVAVAGLRSCFPVAFSLHYALSLFIPRTWLMMGSGGSFLDDLYHVGKGDVFVVVSVAPYSRDIVEAARRFAASGADPAGLDEARFERLLSTAGAPPVDLIVRTSGERRLSNFLLWEAAYAELLFQDVLWPDYGPDALGEAVAEFRRRERRFGGVEAPARAAS